MESRGHLVPLKASLVLRSVQDLYLTSCPIKLEFRCRYGGHQCRSEGHQCRIALTSIDLEVNMSILPHHFQSYRSNVNLNVTLSVWRSPVLI